MAAYFIDYINISSYSNTNKKGRELQLFISRFKQLLIKDDLGLDALKAEIERETERLNKANPRTKPFVINFYSNENSGECFASVDGNDDKVVFYLTWQAVLGTYQFCEKKEEKEISDNRITITQVDLNNWEYDDDSNCKPLVYEVNLIFCNKEYTIYFSVKDIQRYKEGDDLENSACEGDTLYFDSVNRYFENYPDEADRLIALMKECWDDFRNTEDSPYNYMGLIEEEEEAK